MTLKMSRPVLMSGTLVAALLVPHEGSAAEPSQPPSATATDQNFASALAEVASGASPIADGSHPFAFFVVAAPAKLPGKGCEDWRSIPDKATSSGMPERARITSGTLCILYESSDAVFASSRWKVVINAYGWVISEAVQYEPNLSCETVLKNIPFDMKPRESYSEGLRTWEARGVRASDGFPYRIDLVCPNTIGPSLLVTTGAWKAVTPWAETNPHGTVRPQ
jgi:hypothetical protein